MWSGPAARKRFVSPAGCAIGGALKPPKRKRGPETVLRAALTRHTLTRRIVRAAGAGASGPRGLPTRRSTSRQLLLQVSVTFEAPPRASSSAFGSGNALR